MKKIGLLGFSTNCNTEKIENCEFFELLKLSTAINGKEYYRGDIELQAYLDILKTAKTSPLSSQPATGVMVEKLQEMLLEYQNIIVIAPRHELSGTLQNMKLAIDMIPGANLRVHPISSYCVAMPDTICTEKAIDMIQADEPIEDIIQTVSDLAIKLNTYAFPGSIKFLKLSGRVSGAAALVGGLLQIKVVVKSNIDAVIVGHKGRGLKSSLSFIDKEIVKYKATKLYISNLGLEETQFQKVIAYYNEKIEIIRLGDCDIVVGTHFGPDSFGITLI